MTAPVTATGYFGRLDRVHAKVASLDPTKVDPTFLEANPGLCVLTVVASKVPGTSAAVYAIDLGSGWGGAEGAPEQLIGDDRTVHQQFLIPPTGASVGTTINGAALVQGPSVDLTSGRYTLKLLTAVDGSRTWSLNGGRVTCAAI